MVIARQSRSSVVRLGTVLAGLFLLAATALVPASVSAQGEEILAFGERVSSKEFNLAEAVSDARGIWSDGTTLWVANDTGSTVYAFDLSTGSYDSTKDITVSSDGLKRGLWSDDTTMWLAFRESETPPVGDNEVEAYTLSTGRYNGTKSFDLNVDNTEPEGIWSDGTTLWVVDSDRYGAEFKVYAYVLSTGVRDASKDLNLNYSNRDPGGTWSDGTTLWVTDVADDKVYAYTLSSGARDQAKEFNLSSLNGSPFGLWSDGTTMWVSDSDDNKVYAYNISGPNNAYNITTNIGGL